MEGRKIKIVADKAIPFLQGVFEPYAEVVYAQASEIDADMVRDADALMTRTRTRCNASLLEGSSVKIIASATIGLDHVDLEWCDANGISVRNAPGCNAQGVAGYVFSALYGVASRNSIKLDDKVIGIIGVGNVGKRVDVMAKNLGYQVLKNDPPREAVEGHFEFCDLEYLLKNSDIVTMHVPLDDSTRLLADKKFFATMKKGAFFINSSRGEVVDEEALMGALGKLGPVILDTWQNEPHINKELLEKVSIATPHIAGYSYQGKQNGTAAVVRAVARYFGIEELYDFFPPTDVPENEAVRLRLRGKSQGEIASVFQYNYPIFTDDFMFRMDPDNFEKLRENYHYRRDVFIE